MCSDMPTHINVVCAGSPNMQNENKSVTPDQHTKNKQGIQAVRKILCLLYQLTA